MLFLFWFNEQTNFWRKNLKVLSFFCCCDFLIKKSQNTFIFVLKFSDIFLFQKALSSIFNLKGTGSVRRFSSCRIFKIKGQNVFFRPYLNVFCPGWHNFSKYKMSQIFWNFAEDFFDLTEEKNAKIIFEKLMETFLMYLRENVIF